MAGACSPTSKPSSRSSPMIASPIKRAPVFGIAALALAMGRDAPAQTFPDYPPAGGQPRVLNPAYPEPESVSEGPTFEEDTPDGVPRPPEEPLPDETLPESSNPVDAANPEATPAVQE